MIGPAPALGTRPLVQAGPALGALSPKTKKQDGNVQNDPGFLALGLGAGREALGGREKSGKQAGIARAARFPVVQQRGVNGAKKIQQKKIQHAVFPCGPPPQY